MSQEAINRSSRAARRSRSLGPDPSCARCGYDDPDALSSDSDRIACYECSQIGKNKSSLEKHHHLGRKCDPATIDIPGNIHRALSDAQLEHPERLQNGAGGDPFKWLAAGVLGLRDHLAWWVERIGAIAEFCLDVSDWIREQFPPHHPALATFPTLFGMTFR